MKTSSQALAIEAEGASSHSSKLYFCLHDFILGASTILQAKIIEDLENKIENIKPVCDAFFSSMHLNFYAKSHPNDYPTTEKLYCFLYNLYFYHHFKVECCVCMLFFVLKFLKESKVPLFKKNWKNIIATATLISQKIIDENYLSNYEFGLFFDNLDTCELLCEMERDFLDQINYNYEIDEQKYEAVMDILKSVFDIKPDWEINYESLNKIVERSKEMTREAKEMREGDQVLIRRVDAMILDDYNF